MGAATSIITTVVEFPNNLLRAAQLWIGSDEFSDEIAESSGAQVEVDQSRRNGYARVQLVGGRRQSLFAYQLLLHSLAVEDSTEQLQQPYKKQSLHTAAEQRRQRSSPKTKNNVRAAAAADQLQQPSSPKAKKNLRAAAAAEQLQATGSSRTELVVESSDQSAVKRVWRKRS